MAFIRRQKGLPLIVLGLAVGLFLIFFGSHSGTKSAKDTPDVQKQAQEMQEYRKELEDRFVRSAMLLRLGIQEAALREMAAALEPEQLRQAGGALEERPAKLFAPAPQLAEGKETALEKDSAFLI